MKPVHLSFIGLLEQRQLQRRAFLALALSSATDRRHQSLIRRSISPLIGRCENPSLARPSPSFHGPGSVWCAAPKMSEYKTTLACLLQ